jgi:hypothetical protein
MNNEKLKIYIAGPMSGYPDFNHAAFHKQASELHSLGVNVLNPAEIDGGSTDKPWDYYMRKAIALLVQADGVVVLDGWENSKGAKLELAIASALEMPVEYPTPSVSRVEIFRDRWGCVPPQTHYEPGSPIKDHVYRLWERPDLVEQLIGSNPPPYGYVFNNEPVKEFDISRERFGPWLVTITTTPVLQPNPAPTKTTPPPTREKAQETVLQEADRLVSGDRQSAYGHPFDDFTRTGKLWAAILDLPEVSPDQVALCMAALKISRLCHRYKRDSAVDLAGYAKCLDLVVEARRFNDEFGNDGLD